MLMETRDLDMELLRTFVAAAERESFAVAAARGVRTQAARSPPMQRARRGGGGARGGVGEAYPEPERRGLPRDDAGGLRVPREDRRLRRRGRHADARVP